MKIFGLLFFLAMSFQLTLAYNYWHLAKFPLRKQDREDAADLYTALVQMVKKEAEIKARLLEIKIKEEKEAEIYRTQLASRVKSSVARDFLTMRYTS